MIGSGFTTEDLTMTGFAAAEFSSRRHWGDRRDYPRRVPGLCENGFA